MSITIGITGHRFLPQDKLPQIKQAVAAFFAEAKAMHGEIIVLSSLAEGADMICAELALEFGFRLVAPLPFDASEYRKDFPDNVAAQFDSMLAKIFQVFVVSPQEPVPSNPLRGFFYRQAGIYVATQCDILLAIWDGAENNTSDGAGTWETIKIARNAGKQIHYIGSVPL